MTIRRHTAALAAAAAFLFSGCTDMYNGNKMKPLEENRFYADRQSARTPVAGTVPRGLGDPTDAFHSGMQGGAYVTAIPVAIDSALLARGQDRFTVFCSPCHGRTGEGNGMIVQRGFPRPNSFHIDSVRSKPDGYYFDVITNGFGRMYAYAPSVPAADRWAVIAYVRALQLSRTVDASTLSAEERSKLAH